VGPTVPVPALPVLAAPAVLAAVKAKPHDSQNWPARGTPHRGQAPSAVLMPPGAWTGAWPGIGPGAWTSGASTAVPISMPQTSQ
jgi:hypothetical protein